MKALRFLAVNGHQILRIVRGKRRKQPGQVFALPRLLQNSLRGAGQFLELMRGLILHHKLKSAELAQTLNWRRQRGKHDRSRNSKHSRTNAIKNRRRRMRVAFALRIRFQRNENDSLIRGRSRETETSYGERSFRLRYVRQQVRNLLSNRLRVFQ